jgi:hypothetical protein
MMQKKPLQFTYVTEKNKKHYKFHQIKHYKNMLLNYK